MYWDNGKPHFVPPLFRFYMQQQLQKRIVDQAYTRTPISDSEDDEDDEEDDDGYSSNNRSLAVNNNLQLAQMKSKNMSRS